MKATVRYNTTAGVYTITGEAPAGSSKRWTLRAENGMGFRVELSKVAAALGITEAALSADFARAAAGIRAAHNASVNAAATRFLNGVVREAAATDPVFARMYAMATR